MNEPPEGFQPTGIGICQFLLVLGSLTAMVGALVAANKLDAGGWYAYGALTGGLSFLSGIALLSAVLLQLAKGPARR